MVISLISLGVGFWIGAHDAGRNNTYVWVGTGEVLPNNSPLWRPTNPCHGSGPNAHNCVTLYNPDVDLYDAWCPAQIHYVCEV